MKSLWRTQAFLSFTYLIICLWAGYYGFKMLASSGDSWQAFKAIYIHSFISYFIFILIFVGSLKHWRISYILNILTIFPRINNFNVFILDYKENHIAHLGDYGSIPMSYGILDYLNALGAICGVVIFIFGVMLCVAHLITSYESRVRQNR